MISQQTPTKYQVCNRNMPSLQKQVLVKLDNASLHSNQFVKKCFFCNAKYIFLLSPSYALLIVNKQCCSLTINCQLTSEPRLHMPLVLELRVFGRQRLREDGGTRRGNTKEEIFWDIWLQTERGFWRNVSHSKSMRRFLRFLCRHLLEVKHGEGGIHRQPGDWQPASNVLSLVSC